MGKHTDYHAGRRWDSRRALKNIVVGNGALAVVFLLLGTGSDREWDVVPSLVVALVTSPIVAAPVQAHQGFIYGLVTEVDGTIYEGRLRWGGDEEAFWGDYFNGAKEENPWLAYVSPESLEERRPIEIFGIEIAHRNSRLDTVRPFMARFGDIARIEARGRKLSVTLKSGTVFNLDRFGADDLADGLRVWDTRRGVVDLDEWGIRSIELLPTSHLSTAPDRLRGTVRTRHGNFTGFIQWNREEGVATDELDGHSSKGELSIRFDTIRSIAKNSANGSLVTLLDGREIVLSGTRETGLDHRGLYVDDPRYGRVLISWEAFERVDFSPGGDSPAFEDFPPGQPLTGTVTTNAGHRLTGRLVYDLDESETTETLDAPYQDVNYTIPFGMIASVELPGSRGRDIQAARVILHGGEELQLARQGDLGDRNAGMLVFVDDRTHPEYLHWAEIKKIDFDRPKTMYPPFTGRTQ